MRVKYILQAPEGTGESVVEGTPYAPNELGRIEVLNEDHVKVLTQAHTHGYVVVDRIEIGGKPAPGGSVNVPLNHDELGASELREALRHRGVVVADDDPRGILVAAAEAYNERLGAVRRPAVNQSGGAEGVTMTAEQIAAFQQWWAEQQAAKGGPAPGDAVTIAPPPSREAEPGEEHYADGTKAKAPNPPDNDKNGNAGGSVSAAKATAPDVSAMNTASLKKLLRERGVAFNDKADLAALRRIATAALAA